MTNQKLMALFSYFAKTLTDAGYPTQDFSETIRLLVDHDVPTHYTVKIKKWSFPILNTLYNGPNFVPFEFQRRFFSLLIDFGNNIENTDSSQSDDARKSITKAMTALIPHLSPSLTKEASKAKIVLDKFRQEMANKGHLEWLETAQARLDQYFP